MWRRKEAVVFIAMAFVLNEWRGRMSREAFLLNRKKPAP